MRYEFFVAWRHLHAPWHPRKLWVLGAGAILIAAGLGVALYASTLPPPITEAQVSRILAWNITMGGLLGVGWLTLVFGVMAVSAHGPEEHGEASHH